MPVAWKDNPELLGIILQYIEDHKGAAEKPHLHYNDIILQVKRKIGAKVSQNLTLNAIEYKLRMIVKEYRLEDKYNVRDLWDKGLRILDSSRLKDEHNLDDLEIESDEDGDEDGDDESEEESDGNSDNDQQNLAASGTKRKRKAQEIDNLPESQTKRTKVHPASDTQIAPDAITTSPMTTRNSETSVLITLKPPKRRLCDDNEIDESPRKSQKTTHDLDPSNPTTILYNDKTRSKHTNSSGDIVKKRGLKLKLNTANLNQRSNLSQPETSTTATASVPAEADRVPSSIAAVGSDSEANQRICDPTEREGEDEERRHLSRRETTSVSKDTNTNMVPQERTGIRYDLNVGTMWEVPVPTKKIQHLFHPDGGLAVSFPQRNVRSTDEIRATMWNLSFAINATVSLELYERGIDCDGAFKLEDMTVTRDPYIMKVLNRIFPSRFFQDDMRTLRRILIDAQTKRRLSLSTFLEAYIGASITIHALEPPPQGHINKQSASYGMWRSTLNYVAAEFAKREKQNIVSAGIEYEIAENFAVHEYIHRTVIPKIPEKAAALASELYTQIQSFFTAPPTHFHHTPLKHWCPMPDELYEYHRQTREQFRSSGDDDDDFVTSPELLAKLTDIFTMALTGRAEWEARGNAIYSFDFPAFGTGFEHGRHNSYDERLDKRKPNKIFVTTLPGVWVQSRRALHLPYQIPKCESLASVYLLRPHLLAPGEPSQA